MTNTKHFLSLVITLLLLSVIILPVQGQGTQPTIATAQTGATLNPQIVTTTQDCFALSNEATGDLIDGIVTAGFGGYNLYQVFLDLREFSNPSITGILTDNFLTALASNPASAEIFTISLKTMDTPGNIVEACTDGTVQTVPVYGFYSVVQGFPAQDGEISGVGPAYFTHTTDTSGYIATWDVTGNGVTTTYRVFGVAWGVGQPPFSIYLPWAVKSS